MLTDAGLKHLKPKEKSYKVTDRDGMYALVSTKGSISFRLDYRMNGRRETVTFGKYGPADLSLARARELCIDARRAIKEGRLIRTPAIGHGGMLIRHPSVCPQEGLQPNG